MKALGKGAISIDRNGHLHAATIKTLQYPPRKSVIIVYYAEMKILDLADSLPGVIGIVAVPDLPGEADTWAVRWNAHVHGKPQEAPKPLINDPIFVRALEALSSVINLSTGLGHPRDKERANMFLRILRAKGHSDQSASIKSWAVRRGWQPSDATELETLSGRIWALKARPSLSGFQEPNRLYEYWKEGTEQT